MNKNMMEGKKIRFVVVVIAYNRPNSLERLLKSIQISNYRYDPPKIIISIDKSDCKEVLEIANRFKNNFKNVDIILHTENLGLRKHVFACGDLVNDYDALIMLEDDLVVSKEYFNYSYEAVKNFEEDGRIGGISLYNYNIAEFSNLRPFYPVQDGYDNYFSQVPSSWGQVWTREQWQAFRVWYNNQEWEKIKNIKNIVPLSVSRWNHSSWKKFYYYYIASNNKFIVYPRVGHSSNMGEAGVHSESKYSNYQCELVYNFERNYRFSDLSESKGVYDAFFENNNIVHMIDGIPSDSVVCISYYGNQNYLANGKGFLLSTEILDFEIVKSWALDLIPYELNIIYNLKGEGLYLFDLSKQRKQKKIDKWKQQIRIIKYDSRGLSDRKAAYIFLNYVLARLKII